MKTMTRMRSFFDRRVVLIAGVVFVAADLIAIALRRSHNAGDFDISMEFGRRFLLGVHLYEGGLHFPYLPATAMFFSAFALLPKPLAFVLLYSLAIGGLWLVIWMLTAIVCGARPNLRDRVWPIAAITLILAAHYVIRDLDDGGPNLVLLALTMGGIYCVWAGRDLRAAGCLGAAVALKVTVAVFIPFLVWKRRWRLAIYTTIAFACWTALPILRMGPESWWAHQREWIISAAGFAAGFNDAAARYYGESNVANQALRPAVAHLLRARLGFAGGAATATGVIATLAVLGIFCLLTAAPADEHASGIRWLRESSGLLVVAVLLAPIAWVQHMVLAIPAIYLIVADWFAGVKFAVASKVALLLYVLFALVLNRTLLGRARYMTLLGYHAHTLCMLLILALLMLCPQPIEAEIVPDPSLPSRDSRMHAIGQMED
jgi:hypothetical protein